jgi:hypothetical protein
MLAGGDPNEILIRNVALNNSKFCATPFPHFQNCVDFYTIKNKSDSGAPEPCTGAAGAKLPPLPKHCGAPARGQQVALFARTAPRNLCIIHRDWNLELFLNNV